MAKKKKKCKKCGASIHVKTLFGNSFHVDDDDDHTCPAGGQHEPAGDSDSGGDSDDGPAGS